MVRRPILTDEDILASARSVFVERGYGAARTRHIAAAVGLTWGAIALRFGDKQTLFTRAMAGPGSPGDLERDDAAGADLPGLLERLRSRVRERWPLHLHRRLAPVAVDQDREPQELLDWLAAAFVAQACRGAVRSDLSARALAQLVLALLVGDAAQGFVAREAAGTRDPAFIGGVVRLLSAN